MTPNELNLSVGAFIDRLHMEEEKNIVSAYLGAYWQRVKRMPNLKEVLSDIRPKKEQTAEDMLAQIKAINAAMGGTVKEGG